MFGTHRFVFAFDSKKSIRKLFYKPYKTRAKNDPKKMDTSEILDREALYEQLGIFRKTWLPQLGFKNIFLYSGFEADDVIALVIKNAVVPKSWPKDIHWIIVSTDRDLYQLLAPNVSMIAGNDLITEDVFTKKYGIKPDQWVHAKALGGCVSDTIEGIAGIADPAKSASSRAIAYLRGELKGTYLKKIQSKDAQKIYYRNLKLVSLPIHTFLHPILKNEHFCKEDFIEAFDRLDFRQFLKSDTFSKWTTFFKLGDVEQ
jgi:hypothetical protein